MEKFTTHRGVGVPLRQSNVDTDQIIPAVYLKRITRTGFDDALFASWRAGEPDFILNQEAYKRASVLVAGPDFGTGSSREHAVWALKDYGFKVVLAPRFADIFRGNSLKNGLLPIVLDEADVQALMQRPDDELTIDVAARELRTPDGRVYSFPLDGFSQTCLLEGVDQLGYLLGRVPEIERYESEHAR